MKFNALDHVNIVTDDLAGTMDFLVELFNLEVRGEQQPEGFTRPLLAKDAIGSRP